MNILVIFNPVAGGGHQAKLARFVLALQQRHCRVEVYETTGPGDATRHLQSLAGPVDVVVAVGGDGTTNEVINGLPDGIALGVFPVGTANVLARELALPKHPEKAAAIIAEGKDLTIWPSLLDGRRYVLMAGIGYDAWVVEAVDLALKGRIGKGAYVWSMLSQLRQYGQQRYRLKVDGRPYDCFSAIITNGRYYGGSFVLSQQADITAPRMQVLMFQKPGRLALVRFLLALAAGRMEKVDGVQSLSATEVVLESPAGEPIQVDGDLAARLPATLKVDSRPLTMRVARTLAESATVSRAPKPEAKRESA